MAGQQELAHKEDRGPPLSVSLVLWPKSVSQRWTVARGPRFLELWGEEGCFQVTVRAK